MASSSDRSSGDQDTNCSLHCIDSWHFLQIIEEAGVEVNGFTGVPVFQATGLSVKTTQSRRTPLFFNKSDLDAAVGNAYSQKMTQREQVTQAKVDRAQQDMADARKQVSSRQKADLL